MTQNTQLFRMKFPTPFIWVDIANPSKKILEEMSREFSIPHRFLKDCLEPEHLPKYEKLGPITMIVLRHYDPQLEETIEATTVNELTRKLVIFLGDHFLLTIHRQDQAFFKQLRHSWQQQLEQKPKVENAQNLNHFQGYHSSGAPWHENLIIYDLFEAVVLSYQTPIDRAVAELESMEEMIFVKGPTQGIELKKSYFYRRKFTVLKRMMRLQTDLCDKFSQQVHPDLASYFRHLNGFFIKYHHYADELLENLNSLVHLQVSLASQWTNESSHHINQITKVLTIFSIYFLPLNFVVGLYGMNFKFMPELDLSWGYPALLGALIIIVFGLNRWIKQKGWDR